jgi:hypothetical protein
MKCRYPKIWRDPDLSFSKIIPQVAEPETNEDDGEKGDGDSDQGDNADNEQGDHDDMEVDEPHDENPEMSSVYQKPAVTPNLSNILNESNQSSTVIFVLYFALIFRKLYLPRRSLK